MAATHLNTWTACSALKETPALTRDTRDTHLQLLYVVQNEVTSRSDVEGVVHDCALLAEDLCRHVQSDIPDLLREMQHHIWHSFRGLR